MKKIVLIILVLLGIILMLSGCKEQNGTWGNYTFSKITSSDSSDTEEEGVQVTEDMSENTFDLWFSNKKITKGKDIYKYTYEGVADYYEVTIKSPDGKTYWKQVRSGSSSSNDVKFSQKYLEPEFLVAAIQFNNDMKDDNGSKDKHEDTYYIAMTFLFIIGAFSVVFPYQSWQISIGWKFKDAEPSEGYLAFLRVMGVMLILIGLIMVFA